MENVHKIEKQLEGTFKDLPQLSDSTRETLANIWPWLALIGGIVQLWAAWILYALTSVASSYLDAINSLSLATTGQNIGPTGLDKTIIYLGIILLIVDAVILLMAFPLLQKRSRRGWDLLFLAALINLAYGVLQIFTYQRGFMTFVGSLIGSFIAFYLLFQIRGKFGGSKKASGSPKTTV